MTTTEFKLLQEKARGLSTLAKIELLNGLNSKRPELRKAAEAKLQNILKQG
jgi:hypothetical protein